MNESPFCGEQCGSSRRIPLRLDWPTCGARLGARLRRSSASVLCLSSSLATSARASRTRTMARWPWPLLPRAGRRTESPDATSTRKKASTADRTWDVALSGPPSASEPAGGW
jgi:hypothetical protein